MRYYNPEHSEKILDTLHFLLNGEVGRGAALVMVCARDEGLVRNIAHAKISTEFSHVSKTAYNNYLHERFTDKEKSRIISALRTRIGYTKEDDGRLSFFGRQIHPQKHTHTVVATDKVIHELALFCI